MLHHHREPEEMTSDERRAEVAGLLALAACRAIHRLAPAASGSSRDSAITTSGSQEESETRLAVSAEQSGHRVHAEANARQEQAR